MQEFFFQNAYTLYRKQLMLVLFKESCFCDILCQLNFNFLKFYQL